MINFLFIRINIVLHAISILTKLNLGFLVRTVVFISFQLSFFGDKAVPFECILKVVSESDQ